MKWTTKIGQEPSAMSQEDWKFLHECLCTSPDRDFAQKYQRQVQIYETDMRTGSSRLETADWQGTLIPHVTLTQLSGREGLIEKLAGQGIIMPAPVYSQDIPDVSDAAIFKDSLQSKPSPDRYSIEIRMAAENYLRSQPPMRDR